MYYLFQFSSIWAALVLLWWLGLCFWMSFISLSTPFSALSYSCKSVPQLAAGLPVLATSPTVNYCCFLLCTNIIFAAGLSLLFYPVSWLWRPCVPWLCTFQHSSTPALHFHNSPILSYICCSFWWKFHFIQLALIDHCLISI